MKTSIEYTIVTVPFHADATVKLRDHECVLVYCERGFRHVTLSSLEADGNVSKWFSSWRKLF